jgi:hypothetical protein
MKEMKGPGNESGFIHREFRGAAAGLIERRTAPERSVLHLSGRLGQCQKFSTCLDCLTTAYGFAKSRRLAGAQLPPRIVCFASPSIARIIAE